MTASLNSNNALRYSIAGLARQGVGEANRFHILRSTEKNQSAADQALDRISVTSYESDPALAKNLSHLRSVGSELTGKDKLNFNRALLDSVAFQATRTSFGSIQGPLQVLGDLLSLSNRRGPLQAPLEQAFEQIAGSSDDVIARTAANLESTSLSDKLQFARISSQQLTPSSFHSRSEELFRFSDSQDHSQVAKMLLEQAKQHEKHSPSRADFLSGLDAYRIDLDHHLAANNAISGMFDWFDHEAVDFLLDHATTPETRDVILDLVDRYPDVAPPEWANEGYAERLEEARAERLEEASAERRG